MNPWQKKMVAYTEYLLKKRQEDLGMLVVARRQAAKKDRRLFDPFIQEKRGEVYELTHLLGLAVLCESIPVCH